MKSIILIFFFLLLPMGLYSQYISGNIIDKNGQAIEYANVILFSAQDSTFINGTVSDTAGYFNIYAFGLDTSIIKISSIGYADKWLECNTEDMGVIQLIQSSYTLNDVIIKGNRPSTQLKNNALITNIENSSLSKIGTAKDVLGKIPGLFEKDGTIEVFGKGTPLIYINGKKVRNNDELNRLSSENIKNIEVITNPGAKYDASANSVIRIKTKKQLQDGFGFNISSKNQYDYYYSGRQQLELNFQKKDLELFGILSINAEKKRYTINAQQQTASDTLWNLYTNNRKCSKDRMYMGKIGFNYLLNENHAIGAYYQIEHSVQNERSLTSSHVFANGNVYDQWNSSGLSKAKGSPNEANFYYIGQFNKLNIDFNADYLRSKITNNQEQQEVSENYESRTITTSNQNNNSLFAAKAILTYPVANGEISIGEEYTNTSRTNIFQNTESILPNSNNKIKENNWGTFIDFSNQLGKVSFNLGLRYEHATSDYFVYERKQDSQSKVYDNLFPSFSISMPIGNTKLSLSYNSKIKRPGYNQLDGNTYYTNRFHYLKGNPLLKPSKQQSITALLSYKWFYFMANYQHTKNIIMYINQEVPNNPKIAFVTYENYPKSDNLTLFCSFSPSIKWWHPKLNLGLLKQWFRSEYLNETKHFNHPISLVQFHNSFTLPFQTFLQLDGSFQGKGNNQNMELNNQWKFNLNISKSFFNNRLDIIIDCKDIFDTYQFKPNLYNGNLSIKQENILDSRSYSVTVKYKFNHAKNKYKGNGAGNTEKNRL